MMNSLLRNLIGTLDSDEREVVAGDLLEAQESPTASVLQVLSLVARRQLLHWAGWQPWLVLITVALPLAAMLSQTARYFAGWSAVYSWMLVDNTDAVLLRNPGFWYGAREYSWVAVKFAFVLFCCSWACGRLIAQLSRKARLSMALLFVVTSLFVNIVGLPSHVPAPQFHTNDKYFPNGPVFAHVFYRVWFPLIVYAITVLLPFILGIVQTKPGVRQSRALSILFRCSTALVLIALIEQQWLLMELWSWQIIPIRLVHSPNLLPLASIGPACLLVIELGKRSALDSLWTSHLRLRRKA